MITTTTENKPVTTRIFQCDKCGAEMDKIVEVNDNRSNYNPTTNMCDVVISRGLFYPEERFEYKDLLCKECAKERLEELRKVLKEFGYKER